MDNNNAGAGAQDIQQELRKHFVIFGFLIALTIVNFFVSRLHLPPVMTVVSVLSIAAFQAFLVLCYFMHLISERKLIYFFLIITILCFVGLIFLPILGYFGVINGTNHVS